MSEAFFKTMTALAVLCLCISGYAGEKIFTSFARGKWDKSDWIVVKSPRFNYMADFVQMDDHIINQTPDLPDEVIFKKHISRVYSSIMHKRLFKGDCTIRATMSFDHRMAPLIVIAPVIGSSANGEAEFREHYEIVLYDQGINIWYHGWKDGKPYWYKAAFMEAEYKARKPYTLEVKLETTRKGRMMTVSCDGKTFGYMDFDLPESYYAGITGCEGRNRFYDFSIETK